MAVILPFVVRRIRKVWILIGVMEYETRDILGVYSTKERAEKEKSQCKPLYDEYEIEEWEINDGNA